VPASCLRWVPWLAVALAMLAPDAASALSIRIEGPTSGPIVSGVGVENPAVGASIAFTVSLDAPTSINGYELDLAWDPAELAFLSAVDLSGLGFDVAPVGATPTGERAAAIELAPVFTSPLFQVTFEVLAVVRDGLADVRVFATSAGIAPGSLSLDNGAAGVAIAVPEPGPLALLGAVLAVLAGRARRGGAGR